MIKVKCLCKEILFAATGNVHWRDITKTIKLNLKNHKNLIAMVDDKEKEYKVVTSFKNSYGERFVIFEYHGIATMIAGDETSWEMLFLIETKQKKFLGVENPFSFSDEENETLHSILKK